MSYIFETVTGNASALAFNFNGQISIKNYDVEIVNGNRLKVVSTQNEMFSLLEADVSEVEINGTVYSDPLAAQFALKALVASTNEPVVMTKEMYLQLAAAIQATDRGKILPTTPVPVGGWQPGWYTPGLFENADPGTTYPNQNNLKAKKGFITKFLFNGTVWDSVAYEIPQATNSIIRFSDSTFPLVAPATPAPPIQRTHDNSIWQLADGQTANVGDVPGISAKWVSLGSRNLRIYEDLAPGTILNPKEQVISNNVQYIVLDTAVVGTDLPTDIDGKFEILSKDVYISQNVTENNYNVDPSQIVPSEAIYNNQTEDLAVDITKRVDKTTGTDVNYRETTTWHDGSIMDSSKVDDVIFKQKEDGSFEKLEFIQILYPEYFGAKGDGKTDDTQAFLKLASYINSLEKFPQYSDFYAESYTAMPQAMSVKCLSSLGYVIKDSVTFEKPINFHANKILYRGLRDRFALKFISPYKNTIELDLGGYPLADYTSDNYEGVIIENADMCKIDIGVSFYTRAIVFHAHSGKGFAWNQINMRLCRNNLYSLVLKTSNEGWINSNHCNGGSFGGNIELIDPSTVNGRERQHLIYEHGGNNCHFESWVFENMAFEGMMPIFETRAFNFGAYGANFISFINCRIELVNNDYIGIVNSKGIFSWKTSQHVDVCRIVDEFGRYVVLNPIEIYSEKLNKSFKVDGGRRWVKNLDSYSIETGMGVSYDYQNKMVKVFKLDEPITLNVEVGNKLMVILFDDNKNIISDDVLLQNQANMIKGVLTISNPLGAGYKFLNSSNEAEGKYSIPIITEAKYIGIMQDCNEKASIKVEVDKEFYEKIHEDSVRQIPEGFYQIPNYISNVSDSMLVAGEKYFTQYANEGYLITKTGFINNVSGITANGISGQKTITLSDASYFKVGFILNVGQKYMIRKIDGNVVTIDKNLDSDLVNVTVNLPTAEYTYY